MRLFLVLFFLSIFLLFNSCNKDKIEKYLTGLVVHKYTKKPIKGMVLQLQYISDGFLTGGKTVLAETTTNDAGHYMFAMNKSISVYDKYNVETLHPTGFDSTLAAFQFIPESKNTVLGFSKNRFNLIELLPSGVVNVNISSDWENIIPFEYDSVVISSPYETKRVIKNLDKTQFYVDASQVNTFELYFVSKTSISLKFTKNFFVPNYFKGGVNNIIASSYNYSIKP